MAVELYDEHEQSERVRRWIREYLPTIGLSLALALAGIFGFRQWQDYQAGQRALASEYYGVIQNLLEGDQREQAREQFEAMSEAVGNNAYTGLAGMLLASRHVESGELEPAARIYRDILERSSMQSLWPVARLRLARILAAQGDIEAGLALIDGSVPEGYAGLWAETRGDLLHARGRLDEAGTAWREALEHRSGQGAWLLQLKLDAVGPPAAGETS